jgi:hypothetical protein
MMRDTSMKELGHEWHINSGMALGCGEGLWTKWMRRDVVGEGKGKVMVVRNCGSVVLKADSEARQS